MNWKKAAFYVGTGSFLVVALLIWLVYGKKCAKSTDQASSQPVVVTPTVPAAPTPNPHPFTITVITREDRKAEGPGPFWDAEGDFFAVWHDAGGFV